MEALVKINNVSLRYQSPAGEIEALSNISFDVERGELVSIIGPSGCGKSTLLSVIAGLLSADEGFVEVDGKKGGECPELIGYMLQKDTLFPWRTIRKNVTLGLEIRGLMTPENIEYADSLLKTYGLWDFKDAFPSELSGGMRQRCALIRTLAVKPALLLLDEAFSALDYQTRLAVSGDICQIIRREGKTAIIVTHDISEAVSLSDRAVVLTRRPGRIKAIREMKFASGMTEPLDRREQPEFRDYFNAIWRDIDVHIG